MSRLVMMDGFFLGDCYVFVMNKCFCDV